MDNHGESHTRIPKKRFAEQTTSELDARLAEAEALRQMIDLLEGFDGTPDYRARILEWTRTVRSGKARMPLRWKLLRRDDNGHAFEISRFSCRSKALKKLAEFERRAHKQTYWVEECHEASA